jgi:hypothetical protein
MQIAINCGWTFVGGSLMGDSHAEVHAMLVRATAIKALFY